MGLVDNSVEDGERIVIDDTLTVPYFHHQVLDLQKILDTTKFKIDFDIQLDLVEGVSIFYYKHPIFFSFFLFFSMLRQICPQCKQNKHNS